jgi:hypothetical protein
MTSRSSAWFQVREILGLVSRFGLRFVKLSVLSQVLECLGPVSWVRDQVRKKVCTISGSRNVTSGFLGQVSGSARRLVRFHVRKLLGLVSEARYEVRQNLMNKEQGRWYNSAFVVRAVSVSREHLLSTLSFCRCERSIVVEIDLCPEVGEVERRAIS